MMKSWVIENLNYLIFIVCAAIGGITHYLKKRIRKETDVKITQWFGKANIEATLYTGIVFIFIIIGALGTGIITGTMNLWAVMYTGFITGFAVDSGVNSDGKQITKDMVEINKDIHELRDLNR